MSWAAVAGAAVGVVGSQLGSKSNGGAGTTTASKEPWAEAAPWLKANITQGQDLQSQYQAAPFNQQQLNAYSNMGKQTQYANAVVPDLLGQISGQQLGFDRSNPSARPTAYNLNGLLDSSTGTGAGTGSSNLLSILSNPAATSGGTSAANPAPTPAPAAAPQPASSFMQQVGGGGNSMAPRGSGTAGSYGAFSYGDQPQPGTQAYRDMTEYFNYGGSDPSNMYGRGAAFRQEQP